MDGKETSMMLRIGSFNLFHLVYYLVIFFSLLVLGTLLNSKSQISSATAEALREATSRGVKVVIATGKVRTNYFFPHILPSFSDFL